ncbi:hypothetical protein Q9L58_008398 [Maublancomyces gigas]|uniref:FAD-binding PCMH-type domain-containing protein n=1 Tax=Discina gigas TaxID=1032678 RepID=A0ABR3G9V9_9PEZI
MPRNVADVQAAVKCAYNSGIRVTVKGGGHSYGAYGLVGAMVIDMVEFQAVTLDSTTKIANVGGGARLGNMASQIFNLNQRALPHGTCPGVGVGGHAPLGGFGYDSRNWGLLVDTIVALDVVLANGTATSVSATQHPELFWALRGAGPGFAVVTTFHFQTLPAPSVNINYGYTYVFNSASSAASGFQYATNWALQNAPKELGFGIYVGDGKEFVIQGVYYGSKSAFTTLITPLLTGMKTYNQGKTPSTSVVQLGWIDSLTALAGSSLTTPPNGDGGHDNFYVKSLDTHQAAPLSLAALKTLFTYLTTAPPSGSAWFIIANLYGGPGSKITSFPPSTDPASTSSYAGRDSGYVWQLYGYVTNTQAPYIPAITGFVKGMVDSLGSEAAGLPAYAPYADTALSQAEAQTRYWGGGVARLKTIKTQVDPKGILYNPQGF